MITPLTPTIRLTLFCPTVSYLLILLSPAGSQAGEERRRDRRIRQSYLSGNNPAQPQIQNGGTRHNSEVTLNCFVCFRNKTNTTCMNISILHTAVRSK